MRWTWMLMAAGAALATAGAAEPAETVKVVKVIAATRGALYPANRAPLAPSPFTRLPIGSVAPRGWVRHMLELERDGMSGRLAEISPWLVFETSAWADPQGGGQRGWEELPYWLKGYGDLGYVLKDEKIVAAAKRWIDAALASQREDGWFGPRALLTSIGGQADLWPHMVMLNILQSRHEATGDARALEAIRRYLKWEDGLPPAAFGVGYWPKVRAGDNIETCGWLYNRTGEEWLLGLAGKIHANMARWDEDIINWHNVNVAQGFRAGTVFWMVSGNPAHLASAERNRAKVFQMYGQFPGGGFAADENARPGYIDPRQGFETCGIVEFMHSYEMLLRITGDPVWADRCEELAFNAFPAAMTPDLKGLHYLTGANQVQLDRRNKAPGIQNGGTMFSYSPWGYRCCQHNVAHGWPYYAEELWLATHDGGLCAALYAASEVTAKVAGGGEVRLVEETDYPFGEDVTFTVRAAAPARFPLHLRIPRWCQGASAEVNGRRLEAKPEPSSYLVVDRAWKDGDRLTLRLPMRLGVRTWAANKDSVSVDYGPLTFSLKIPERWEKSGGRPADWPEWEVFPDGPWNYGLVLDAADPAASFALERRKGPPPAQPWTHASVPLALRAKAKKIPAWQTDGNDLITPLQPSPLKSEEPVETVTLIPMGAARLRLPGLLTLQGEFN